MSTSVRYPGQPYTRPARHLVPTVTVAFDPDTGVAADDVEARGVQDAEPAPEALVTESDFQDLTVDAPVVQDDVEARTVLEAEAWIAEEAAAGEITQPPDEVEFLAHESIAELGPDDEVVASEALQGPDEVEVLADVAAAELAPEDPPVDSDFQDVTVDAQAAAADDVEARGVLDADAPPDDVVIDSDFQEPVVAAAVIADDVEARGVFEAEAPADPELVAGEELQPPDDVSVPEEAIAAQFPPDEDLSAAQGEIAGIVDQVVAVADLIESIADGLELLDPIAESLDQADPLFAAPVVATIAGQTTRPMPGEEGGRFTQTGGSRPAVTGGSRPAQGGGSRPSSGGTSRGRVTH